MYKKLSAWLVKTGYLSNVDATENEVAAAAQKAFTEYKLTPKLFNELTSDDPTPDEVFGNVRLKKPSERYSNTKSVAKHITLGTPVKNERGKEVETTSELEYAKAGSFLKYTARKAGLPVDLSDHESELVGEMFERDSWCGKIGGEYRSGIEGIRVKALIDDATSGGSELVPEWFDDQIVTYPLLHSEFLPRVDIRDVPRSSSVEAATLSNPTVFWGTAEGTAITPFDTSSLVGELNTDIARVVCAIEVGQDFLSDAAANVGQVLMQAVGQRLLSELDRVIVEGNGTTEPEGIFTASGLTDIGNPAGGAGADAQVDDYEALLFAIPKQYRMPQYRPAFFANDTTYSRARGIPVGASDARRVFGMSHEDYVLLNRPFLISNDIGNNLAGFGCLQKYRLYRRQAQSIRWETGGKELALKNLALMVVTGRYGGRVVDPSAFAFSDNWKA